MSEAEHLRRQVREEILRTAGPVLTFVVRRICKR